MVPLSSEVPSCQSVVASTDYKNEPLLCHTTEMWGPRGGWVMYPISSAHMTAQIRRTG